MPKEQKPGDKTWEEFEKWVKDHVSSLAKQIEEQDGVLIHKIEHNIKLPRTGYEMQFDAVAYDKAQKHVAIIETKCLQRTVGQGDIEKLAFRKRKLELKVAILASQSGFTRNAEALARGVEGEDLYLLDISSWQGESYTAYFKKKAWEHLLIGVKEGLSFRDDYKITVNEPDQP